MQTATRTLNPQNPFVAVIIKIVRTWTAEGRDFTAEDVHASMIRDFDLDAPCRGSVEIATQVMRDLELAQH